YTEAVRWFYKGTASSLARCLSKDGPLAGWTSIAVILLGLPILLVPQRRWGRATWLPHALTSAVCAAQLAHELLLSPRSLALLTRGLAGTLHSGFGRVLFLAFLAGGSVIYAIVALRVAVRGSKTGWDQGQAPTPLEGTQASPT